MALMAAAFYVAWTIDFQAQGRYLLPIVGMVSILVYHLRDRLANPPCMFIATALFLLSVYSYIFVALAGIAKI